MSRHWVRRGAAAGVAALLAASTVAVTALPALAVSNVKSAYWWAGGPAPQPNVPTGGLYVAATASGPQGESAVMFALDSGESAPTLTLSVAQSDTANNQVSSIEVLACPASAPWTDPGGPGSMSSAPAPDCSKGSSYGQLSGDGKTMTFDLSSLATGAGPLDVVLTPGTTAAPAQGTVPNGPSTVYPTFDISFNKVTTASITTTGAPAAGPTGGAAPVSVGGAQPTTAGAAAPPASAPAATGAFSAPITSNPGEGSSPVVAPAQQQPVASGPQVAAPAQQQPVAASAPVSRWNRNRVILMLLVFNIGVYIWWEGQRRAAAPGRPRRNLFDPPPAPEQDANAA